jgi:hypothetical protein
MFLRLAVGDDHITHLWPDTPPTQTACGNHRELGCGLGKVMCPGCVEAFGAEEAAAFPELVWVRSHRIVDTPMYFGVQRGRTRHAFVSDLKRHKGTDRVWPVCHMRSYDPSILVPDPHTMRCPHCVHSLRMRLDGLAGENAVALDSPDRGSTDGPVVEPPEAVHRGLTVVGQLVHAGRR